MLKFFNKEGKKVMQISDSDEVELFSEKIKKSFDDADVKRKAPKEEEEDGKK